MAMAFSHAHALVMPSFALISKLVDSGVDALIPDKFGYVFVIVLHALRAISFAES